MCGDTPQKNTMDTLITPTTPSRLAQLHDHLLYLSAQSPEGFLPFDRFMAAALYTPNLGYYTATRPVGSAASGADFTTAPEISALFGHTLAQAIRPCFATGLPVNILECGAGTGKLAKDVLDGLAALHITVERYLILELSSSLRAQQQSTLQDYLCVEWLDALPPAASFKGVVLANELLDAIPVQAFVLENGTLFERGIRWSDAHHGWEWAQTPHLDSAAHLNKLPEETKVQPRYEFEVGTQAFAWVASMAHCIESGAMLLIDYGFANDELYHPQRSSGTLMAHRLHQATPNVLAHAGDADITAHVNFTAVAQAATNNGMTLTGYVNQARFLVNADIASAFMRASQQFDASDTVAHAQLSRGLQWLMSEAEMGELFKVIAWTRDCQPPSGFERGDRSHRLLVP
jgi:SAM-dependent MidA family methyltransferase